MPALAAYSIQQEFVANELTELRAVHGVYLLETRQVWAPRLGDVEEVGLAVAPTGPAGFADLGNAVAQSKRIASYLIITLEKWRFQELRALSPFRSSTACTSPATLLLTPNPAG